MKPRAEPRPADPRRDLVLRASGLVLVLALSVGIFVLRDRIRELAVYGYPGIFLFSILTNATIILPAPGIALVFTMGAVLPPLGVAIAAGLGAGIGELSGYVAGVGGQTVVEEVRSYRRLRSWMERNRLLSYLMVMGLAFIPNPFMDLAGIAAGALRLPVLPFLMSVWVGKFIKMLVIAYIGASSLPWLFPNM